MSLRIWLILAGLNGAMAVIAGAATGHNAGGGRAIPELVDLAARYQMFHALALLGLAALSAHRSSWRLIAAGACFTAGCVLFSGALYIHGLTGYGGLAILTPFGGTAFILGWLALIADGFWPMETRVDGQ